MLTVLATEGSSSLDITGLVQYGVLGLVLILVLFGYLWAKPSVDSLQLDKKKAEDQRDALITVYQTEVIPVLNEVQKHVVPGMAQVLERQAELIDRVETIQRAVDSVLQEVRTKRS